MTTTMRMAPVELQLDAAGGTADCWLSGARLDEIANQYDFQLISEVLSHFIRKPSPTGRTRSRDP